MTVWVSKTVRKPEILTKGRAEGLTNNVVSSFFDMLEAAIEDAGMKDSPDLAERLHNCDEAGLATNPVNKKVFIPKNEKNAYLRAAGAGKTSYSILFCISATGKICPPFVVYKGKHLYQAWTSGGPNDTSYGVTVSGWMEDVVFEDWFTKHYLKWASTFKKPCILFLDGHGSHLTYNVVKSAQENGIIMICLPPHTSHELQPCDVGFFRPLKVIWKDVLKSWFRETRMQIVDKAVFPALLGKLWLKLKPSSAVAGFTGSGLYPVDREKVKKRVIHTTADETDYQNTADTPRKLLRKAIVDAVTPSPSEETKNAMKNSKRKRRRVQANVGEILTSADVIEIFRRESIERSKKKARKEKAQAKEKNANFQTNGSSPNIRQNGKRKSKARKLIYVAESAQCGPSASTDSDDEGNVPCISCGKLFGDELKKLQPHWVSCDICTVWTCISCLPEDFDLNKEYVCVECSV